MIKHNLDVVREITEDDNTEGFSIGASRTTNTSKEGGTESYSNETVKFDGSRYDISKHASNHSAISERQHPPITDETLQLFNSMPKGLESFLETGPSRRVVDYMDYEKLVHVQKKKVDYLEEQKIPQRHRGNEVNVKSLELMGFIKQFDMFITEAQKKRKRAIELCEASKNANKELSLELPRAKERLNELKEVRDNLEAKVNKMEKVEHFVDSVIKLPNSPFGTFSAIMDRSSTLKSTNNYLARRYSERHRVESLLVDELQEIKTAAGTHDIMMRRQMNEHKKELQRLMRKNLDIEMKCQKWSKQTADLHTNAFLQANSIKAMTTNIARARPFFGRKLEGKTDPCELLEKIGLFITDYTEIAKVVNTAKNNSIKNLQQGSKIKGTDSNTSV